VGESPPVGKTYFYCPEALRGWPLGLPAKVFRGLFQAKGAINKEECRAYLDRFKASKCLLIDLCPYPIGFFEAFVKLQFVLCELPQFRERICALTLSETCVKILVLPSKTYEELRKDKNRDLREFLKHCGFGDDNIVEWRELENRLSEIRDKVL
jgi:hypothetical protein